jgi:hypothetical protein
VSWGVTLAERPQPRGFDVNQPGSTRETFTGLAQGATTDLVGSVVDLGAAATGIASQVDPRLLSMSPKAALLSYLNPFAEQAQEVAGSEALGQRVFGDAPTEELQKIRDDARLVGGIAGLGEMLTAKGAKAVAGGIEDFMQFLPNVRAQAVTPEGQMLPLPDDTLPDTSITEILAGRNSTTGPAKEKIAKELRKMGKNEDEIFRATQAYFDSDVLGRDTSAFRYEIPNTEKSTLKIGDTSSPVSRYTVKGGDYFYSKDRVSFGFKPDVQRYEYDPDAEDLFLNDMPEAARFADGKKGFGRAPTLSEVLDFPELFEEYPQLRDVYVVGVEAPNIKVGGETKQLGGFYLHDGIRGEPTIAMAQATNARDFQSSLLHEIQHAVQAIEHTPGGGEFMSIYNSLKERLGVEGDSDYVMGRALNVYEALYGEIEARVVQQRFLNPELKKETPVATRKREAADTDIVIDETDAVDTIDDAIREELEYGDVDYEEVYPNQFQASLTTAPKSTGLLGGDKPQRFFHGTGETFKDFDPDAKYTFVSSEPRVANFFAQGTFEGSPNIRPVYLKDANFFDPKNPAHLESLAKSDWYKSNRRKLRKHPFDRTFLKGEGRGSLRDDYNMIEATGLDDALQEMGYDGFATYEMGAKNLAVFNVDNIVPGVRRRRHSKPARRSAEHGPRTTGRV